MKLTVETTQTLKTPVSRPIQQLLVSPEGDYLAIVTSHTVHIAVLPHSALLTSEDTTPLKIKTFQLGPTSHVLDRSPIAAVLWHPLGIDGTCLVTVTVDAIVRLWELDKENRWSFDTPALAFDLKKLVDGTTVAEDFSPSKYGTNKGFSPDSFELEVSTACFGMPTVRNENGWAPMTLWLAMREGDIYALCPFLPSKWQAPPDLDSSFRNTVELKNAATVADTSATKAARDTAAQQSSWMTELEEQLSTGTSNIQTGILHRPAVPGAIPMLQGPFCFAPEADEVFDITDIHYLKVAPEQDENNDDWREELEDASLGFLCLATSDNQVHVCLDYGGVEGRWLPNRTVSRCNNMSFIRRLTDLSQKSESKAVDDAPAPELLLLESVAFAAPSAGSWPVFTSDEQSENSVLVTHSAGLARVDLTPLVKKLTDELQGAYESGGDFRMELLVQSTRCDASNLMQVQRQHPPVDRDGEVAGVGVAACINIEDSDLGDFLLSSFHGQPQAVTLDSFVLRGIATTDEGLDDELGALTLGEVRQSYQPPGELWAESSLGAFISEHVQGRNRRSFKEEVKLSPATLRVLMDAHRILSHETYQLGLAAADLFRRCERLQSEFKEQIRRANDAATRIESVLEDEVSELDEGADGMGMSENIERRMETARQRQEELSRRYVELRRKMGRLDGQLLSEKEEAWMEEVRVLEASVGATEDTMAREAGEKEEADAKTGQRLDKVQKLTEQLVQRAKAQSKTDGSGGGVLEVTSASPSQRQWRMGQISGMLERQSALVEATRLKMDRLCAMAAP